MNLLGILPVLKKVSNFCSKGVKLYRKEMCNSCWILMFYYGICSGYGGVVDNDFLSSVLVTQERECSRKRY